MPEAHWKIGPSTVPLQNNCHIVLLLYHDNNNNVDNNNNNNIVDKGDRLVASGTLEDGSHHCTITKQLTLVILFWYYILTITTTSIITTIKSTKVTAWWQHISPYFITLFGIVHFFVFFITLYCFLLFYHLTNYYTACSVLSHQVLGNNWQYISSYYLGLYHIYHIYIVYCSILFSFALSSYHCTALSHLGNNWRMVTEWTGPVIIFNCTEIENTMIAEIQIQIK